MKLLTILNTHGDHIKKRRLELGLYQRQVAKILEVDESTVTNWEKNRTGPTRQLLPKVIQSLGYDPASVTKTQLWKITSIPKISRDDAENLGKADRD